jgi:hypothetical protein
MHMGYPRRGISSETKSHSKVSWNARGAIVSSPRQHDPARRPHYCVAVRRAACMVVPCVPEPRSAAAARRAAAGARHEGRAATVRRFCRGRWWWLRAPDEYRGVGRHLRARGAASAGGWRRGCCRGTSPPGRERGRGYGVVGGQWRGLGGGEPLVAAPGGEADIFEREVLPRLDGTDRAMLGQVGSAWRALVASCPSLPRAGLQGGEPLKVAAFVDSAARLAWAKTNGCPWWGGAG